MILHKEHKHNFTMVDNDLLADPRLSAKSKGIICYLLSKPDGWNVVMRDLQNHFTDGEESLRSGLKELYAAGYARVETVMDDNGHFKGRKITISETPNLGKAQFGETTH